MLRHEFGMLSEPIARALDLYGRNAKRLCQFSRRSAPQIPAIFASTQAVARTARTIAVFRICRQRRTAARNMLALQDRHHRKFRSSS